MVQNNIFKKKNKFIFENHFIFRFRTWFSLAKQNEQGSEISAKDMKGVFFLFLVTERWQLCVNLHQSKSRAKPTAFLTLGRLSESNNVALPRNDILMRNATRPRASADAL